MNIQRKRWVIERFGDGAILCGTAGHHHFELPDKLLNCNIRTFASEKLATSASRQADLYGAKTVRIVPVIESIDEIEAEKQCNMEVVVDVVEGLP